MPKQRSRRGEALPHDAALVLRGDDLDPGRLTRTAQENSIIYGFFGISVFVEVDGFRWEAIASERLVRAEWLAIFTVGDLLRTGLALWDTGRAPALRCCAQGLLEPGRSVRRLPAPSRGKSALPAARGRYRAMKIDLRADLNREDDDCFGWTLLSEAARPGIVRPDAVLRAGTEKFWSWVRVTAVDEDGQVHFRQITGEEAKASGQLAETG
jgi:hypothetical protein